MALLKQCFCYSLRLGSFIIGGYSLIVYCVAFAVELWWIIESMLILPAPAYTLCALYFFNFVMAAVLLFGLLIRQRKYLMSWTLMTVLSFFPEAGMVLFMSLYYWPTQKFEYGVIELVFWAFRAIFNIFGALCVCSLYLTWRDEEMILGRLHDLTLSNVERNGTVGFGNVNGTLKRSDPLAYHNYAYTDSTPVLNSQNTLKASTLQRNHFGRGSHLSIRSSVGSLKTNEFSPTIMFDPMYKQHRISELGIAGIGLDPPGSRQHAQPAMRRSRSLWNINNDDYWNRPPPSRPVSLGYVNHVRHYEGGGGNPVVDMGYGHHGGGYSNNNTLSLDRRKLWASQMGRRAASMDGLNNVYRYYGQNLIAVHQKDPWSKGFGQGSDDIQYYRDIAL